MPAVRTVELSNPTSPRSTSTLDIGGNLTIGVDYAGSNAGPQNGAIIEGSVGIGTTTPTLGPLEMGSGAYVTSGGVWTNASSRSYKDDIADLPLASAAETLTDLRPVTFRFKTAPKEKHVGFIAEDVPRLVATPDRKGLSPMDIVAVLTKVVQDQQRRIDALERQLGSIRQASDRRKSH